MAADCRRKKEIVVAKIEQDFDYDEDDELYLIDVAVLERKTIVLGQNNGNHNDRVGSTFYRHIYTRKDRRHNKRRNPYMGTVHTPVLVGFCAETGAVTRVDPTIYMGINQ